ncbi:MAG: hypothetical protein AB7H93_23450 [Vicinamibacterales bacterium]
MTRPVTPRLDVRVPGRVLVGTLPAPTGGDDARAFAVGAGEATIVLRTVPVVPAEGGAVRRVYLLADAAELARVRTLPAFRHLSAEASAKAGAAPLQGRAVDGRPLAAE